MRVLIVDDHLDTRIVCAAVIASLGHTVESAPTVAAAVAIARVEAFDLLISDIMLPDGTGYDLLRTINSERRLRGIALTGLHTPADIERCRSAGFVRHLCKPIDPDTLERVMHEMEATTPAITIAAPTFDGSTHPTLTQA